MTANTYSSMWFDVFSDTRPSTDREIDFLVRNLPNPPCHVLDVCCGRGRLSIPLARMGYDVVGVDRNTGALDVARADDTGAQFVELDVRDLTGLAGRFDAVICMWQSFGFLSEAENDQWQPSRCRAAAFNSSRSASVCADPTCSMFRDLRRCECTICTARAPDAVLTVRTYATTTP